MFLTGFDSEQLNTLYVDKNLKHHGLIQAFSRTNRINDELKSQGNIVCFRNLKSATDDAIRLFSSLDKKDEIIMAPYEEQLRDFDEACNELLSITPTVESVDELLTEEDELAFVLAFRKLIRLLNVLKSYTQFNYDDLSIDEQMVHDFSGRYGTLKRKVENHLTKEKYSILDDINFELELIHRDEINVLYIINLLKDLKNLNATESVAKKDEILNLIKSEFELQSKLELIEKFINKHIPLIADADSVPDAFEIYWEKEKQRALKAFSKAENLDLKRLDSVIEDYIYTDRKPLRDDVISMMEQKPKLKERSTTAERLIQKVTHYVDTFISGIGI